MGGEATDAKLHRPTEKQRGCERALLPWHLRYKKVTDICLVAVDTGGELEGGVGGIEVGRHDLVDGTLVCDECVVQHATEAWQKGKKKKNSNNKIEFIDKI